MASRAKRGCGIQNVWKMKGNAATQRRKWKMHE